MKKIYIAGPMRGHKHYNFPAFDAAAERLRRLGFEPVNPADADRALGFDPMTLPEDHDWSRLPQGWDIREVAKRCCDAVIGCDGVAMLEDWGSSKGAVAEKTIADWLKIPVVALSLPDRFLVELLKGGMPC
jgi:hypothetical protein